MTVFTAEQEARVREIIDLVHRERWANIELLPDALGIKWRQARAAEAAEGGAILPPTPEQSDGPDDHDR